jgi:DNA-binding MarR family transcriptional regulator
MDLQGQRDLLLLRELDRDGGATQRTLAIKLGVALGLTNLYLKRLARKGYIKTTTIPRNRIRYLLTPQGIIEKSRLIHLHMQCSLSNYRDIRTRLTEMMSTFAGSHGQRVVIYGTTELAELVYLSLREMNVDCVGFIDGNSRESFLSCSVVSPDSLSQWQFDRVLIADLEHADACEERLAQSGVPREKVLRLGLPE